MIHIKYKRKGEKVERKPKRKTQNAMTETATESAIVMQKKIAFEWFAGNDVLLMAFVQQKKGTTTNTSLTFSQQCHVNQGMIRGRSNRIFIFHFRFLFVCWNVSFLTLIWSAFGNHSVHFMAIIKTNGAEK